MDSLEICNLVQSRCKNLNAMYSYVAKNMQIVNFSNYEGTKYSKKNQFYLMLMLSKYYTI